MLSAHNCSKVLGVLLEVCDGRTPNTRERKALLIYCLGLRGIFLCVFCAV